MSDFVWMIPGDTLASGAPAPSVESTLLPTPLDHVALGLSRLRLQFQDKPKLAALLTSWLNQSNEIEAAAIQVLTLRCLDNATGVQLDAVGEIVGQARAGAVDDVYRRYIRARILVNNSGGTVNELIRIAQLVLNLDPTAMGQVVLRCFGDATAILEIVNVPVTTANATVLKSMVTSAEAGGARIVVQWSAVPLAQTFRFDTGPGFDAGQFAQGADLLGGYV